VPFDIIYQNKVNTNCINFRTEHPQTFHNKRLLSIIMIMIMIMIIIAYQSEGCVHGNTHHHLGQKHTVSTKTD
jgi:hypothetical protein